jgi:hypothetical protein
MPLTPAQLQHADELTRPYRKRAEAVADREWRRVLEEDLPPGTQVSADVERVFKRAARLAYLQGMADQAEATSACLNARRERHQLRQAGRDPDQAN